MESIKDFVREFGCVNTCKMLVKENVKLWADVCS